MGQGVEARDQRINCCRKRVFVKSMVSATQETNLSADAHTLQEAWTEKDKPHTPSRGKMDFGTPPFSASKIDSLPGGSHRQTQKQTQKNRKKQRDRACGCCLHACVCVCVRVCVVFVLCV